MLGEVSHDTKAQHVPGAAKWLYLRHRTRRQPRRPLRRAASAWVQRRWLGRGRRLCSRRIYSSPAPTRESIPLAIATSEQGGGNEMWRMNNRLIAVGQRFVRLPGARAAVATSSVRPLASPTTTMALTFQAPFSTTAGAAPKPLATTCEPSGVPCSCTFGSVLTQMAPAKVWF